MTVTALEKISAKKIRIYIDYEEYLSVNISCVSRSNLDIYEGKSFDESQEKEFTEWAEKQAQKAAMDSLLVRDRSEKEMSQLLRRKGFAPCLSDKAISYVSSYGYLDDDRFARNYIAGKKGSCSKQMLILRLKEKGVKDDIIFKALCDEKWDDKEGIIRELRRKCPEKPEVGDKQYQKLCQSLIRKGYNYRDIKHVLTNTY